MSIPSAKSVLATEGITAPNAGGRKLIVLTAKGQRLSPAQISTARQLMLVAQQESAPTIAAQACIFDAIMESNLGENLGPNSSGYGGVLGGNVSYFGDVHSSLVAEARAFFQGGQGFQAGGAIAASATQSDVAKLGASVTAPFTSQYPPPYGEYISQGGITLITQVSTEAAQIVGTYAAGKLPATAGAGTNPLTTSIWTVGDPSNPDQDYWTTINQYAMAGQLYAFTDAETLFLADGTQLMAQEPAAIVSRLDPAVVSMHCTWDNTTFQYTHTHTKKSRVQRRTSLAKLTSPTMVTTRIICDIDKYRAGDTVILVMCGPADGVWLLGDVTREIYNPFSDLTLVQATQPLNAASGLPGPAPYLTGKQASQPTAGTPVAAMISRANTINTDDYPYVWGGGHTAAGTPDIGKPGGNGYDGHTIGFDCSGAVAAVLAAGGLYPTGTSVGSDASLIQTLLSNHTIVPGPGNSNPGPEVTLFDQSGIHIFMRINGQYFGTSDGTGHLPLTGNQGAGWIPNGQPGSFTAYHVPQALLGQQTAVLPTSVP